MENELYLSVYLANCNRTVVIEGDGFSVWLYVLNQEHQAVEFSGILGSLGKLSTEPEEVQRFTREGNQPPLLDSYASPEAVLAGLSQEDIRVEEVDEDIIMIYVEDEAYAQILVNEQRVLSKALRLAGPYGEPFAATQPATDQEE